MHIISEAPRNGFSQSLHIPFLCYLLPPFRGKVANNCRFISFYINLSSFKNHSTLYIFNAEQYLKNHFLE